MAYPVLKASNTWFDTAKASRTAFKTIRIMDLYTPAEDFDGESWNADVGNTGAIKCYVVGTELIIAGNGSGKIAANADSSFLFSASVTSASNIQTFKNVTHIYGAELLDMSGTTTLKRAFAYDLNLEYVDVEDWNISNVTSIEYILGAPTEAQGVTIGGMKIKYFPVGKWNTGKVKSFRNAFLCCTYLESLDVGGWDMSSAEDVYCIVRGCTSLKAFDMSRWETPKLEDMGQMISKSEMIRLLDFRTFDNQNAISTTENMFSSLFRLEIIRIGENFSFGADYPKTPLAEYIEGADGMWHTADGKSYAPMDVPSGGINATYYASPLLAEKARTPVILSGDTAMDIAYAVREKTGKEEKLKPTEYAAAIRGI